MNLAPLVAPILLLLCISANAQTDRLDPGLVKDGVYINTFFGFSYQYPRGWVVHGEATNERIRELGKERAMSSGALSEGTVDDALNSTHHLLTVFRQPMGTSGLGYNPGLLVVAEKVAHAPGINNGKDYLLSMRELMLTTGSSSLLKEPMEYRFAGSQFFRDNYGVEVNGLQITQAYFANVIKGYAVVFIFSSEDQKSLDEMVKTMQTFMLMPPARKSVKAVSPAPERKPN